MAKYSRENERDLDKQAGAMDWISMEVSRTRHREKESTIMAEEE